MKRTTTDAAMHVAHFEDGADNEDKIDEECIFETDTELVVLSFWFGSFRTCACPCWCGGGDEGVWGFRRRCVLENNG